MAFVGVGTEVVCKFRFVAMHTFESWDGDKRVLGYDLEFVPVSGSKDDTAENKTFWKYTPSGSFKFATINAEAAKLFKFGHEYYVTFREAPAEVSRPPIIVLEGIKDVKDKNTT
jgi:hypothetical protein